MGRPDTRREEYDTNTLSAFIYRGIMTDELEIGNINTPEATSLLEQFKNRASMTTVDVSEVIDKLLKVLVKDYDAGRPKKQNISYGHLGNLLKIGKGGISQYTSVWAMPHASKEYLKKKDLPLIKAYYVSRVKGKDEDETVRMQINEINRIFTGGAGNRSSETLIHKTLAANAVLKTAYISKNIPEGIFEPLPNENALASARVTRNNIQKCINMISPRIQSLPLLKDQLSLCENMLNHDVENCICGGHVSREVLQKQISFLSEEVYKSECEYRNPLISSLRIAENDLSVAIKEVEN